jgi:hypothetical protein
MICGAFCADANNGWTSLFPGKYIPGTECGSCCRTRLLVPKPVELEAQLRVTKPWKCRLSLHDWEVWGRPGPFPTGLTGSTHISHLSQAKTMRAIRAEVSKFSVNRFLVTASDIRSAISPPAQPPPTPPIPNVVSD